MFSMLENAKPDTGNIRNLNLPTVNHTTVQVTKLPLLHDLLKAVNDIELTDRRVEAG
jgi:hypothetical protein